eukprot:1193541-Prorocentrum_minimum.AAC.2
MSQVVPNDCIRTQSSLVFYHAICKCCNIDGYLPKPDERKRSRQVERSDGIHTELTFRLTYRIVHHTLIAACMKDPMQWVTDKRSKIALPLFVTTNWLPWDTISLSKPVSIHHGFAKSRSTRAPKLLKTSKQNLKPKFARNKDAPKGPKVDSTAACRVLQMFNVMCKHDSEAVFASICSGSPGCCDPGCCERHSTRAAHPSSHKVACRRETDLLPSS